MHEVSYFEIKLSEMLSPCRYIAETYLKSSPLQYLLNVDPIVIYCLSFHVNKVFFFGCECLCTRQWKQGKGEF